MKANNTKRMALRRMPRLASLLGLCATLGLASCGGGGGDSAFDDRLGESTQYAAQCAQPRSGNDPYNDNAPYPDRQGSIADERNWVRAYMNEVYLWYRDIPSVNAEPYTAANYGTVMKALNAYFLALKTPKKTASGNDVDRFSFTYPTAQWEALSQSGVDINYGLQFAALATYPPRDFRVAYTEPERPSSNANVERGAKILAIDGVDMINGSNTDALKAGLFPDAAGEQHLFRFQDVDGTVHDELLTAAAVTETPVQNVKTLTTANGKVGYLLFNDHIATAEGELIDAMNTLKSAGISDLVLDMRYNGGGYLDIASELAYMIAGSSRTTNKVFEQLSFNDKNPLNNANTRVGFHDRAVGFDPSVTAGSALPTLGLGRVYVLAGPGTCSASEAVVNGLRGINVDVVLIGDTSCGKPYGFYPTDNCGLTYFAIEFKGVNNKGFGDYADGFPPTCAVDDDFTHALGDPNEALLATALDYRQSGNCGVTAKRTSATQSLQVLRSPLRENRILSSKH